MTCAVTGGTLAIGNVVNRCHRFFLFRRYLSNIDQCFLMAAIPESAPVFRLIITVSFYTLETLRSAECCLPFTFL